MHTLFDDTHDHLLDPLGGQHVVRFGDGDHGGVHVVVQLQSHVFSFKHSTPAKKMPRPQGQSEGRLCGGRSCFAIAAGGPEIRPVHIWTQLIASYGACAFTLNIDAQAFTSDPSVCDIGQLLARCSAAPGKFSALINRQSHEKRFEVHD